MRRGSTGALIALAAVLTICSGAEAAKRAPKEFFGVTSQTYLEAVDYRKMDNGRVGTLRVNFPWSEVDPPPTYEGDIYSPRAYRWGLIDPTMRKAAKRGIRILPTVYGTPHWVAQYQNCPTRCNQLGPTTFEGYIAFYQFMYAAAQRYGDGGSFWAEFPGLPYRPIRVWQIWNEQNSSDYWKPGPNVENYATLFAVGAEAVKAVDSGAQTILGGMLIEPAQPGKLTMPGWEFLNQLYQRPRAANQIDGIAVHPYSITRRQLDGTIFRWRKELRTVGAPQTKIYVTELGWASGGPANPLNLGLAGQAKALDRSLRYFTKNRKKYNFARVVIYSWRDGEPGAVNCVWCLKSGLIRYQGRKPKPAWGVFRKWTGALKPK